MKLISVTLKGVNNPKDKQTCGILVDGKEGEVWLNGWQDARTRALNKGETIQIFYYEEEYNGKMWKKFRLPSLDFLLTPKDDTEKLVREAGL